MPNTATGWRAPSARWSRPTDARTWLDLAFRKADEPGVLKLRSLDQSELKSMWTEAQAIG